MSVKCCPAPVLSTARARARGCDANKKLSGRKRHIAVNTDGRLLAINLTPTDIADSTGAQLVLDGLALRWPWIKHLFGDAAYDRRQLMDKAAFLEFTVEVVQHLKGKQGFAVPGRSTYLRLADALPTIGKRL